MRGYTVLELMIVIGTIAVLTTMGLLGLRGANEREQLVAAQRQLLGDLRSAQNKAISGKEKAGFRIKAIDNNSYVFYARLYSDFGSCSPIVDPTDTPQDCPAGAASCSHCDKEIARVNFDEMGGIGRFVSFTPDSFDVYFFRPPNSSRAKIFNPAGNSVTITFTHTKILGVSKKVTVDATGDVAKIYED